MSAPSKAAAAFLTAFLAVLVVAGCAAMQGAAAVPENLRPGAGESLAMIVPARGVQIYECRASKDKAGEYDWAFVAPEADLFDPSGSKKIGSHYAGPHWEAADGSRVQGTVKEHADAPSGDAIPWLLLAAKSVGPEGSFSRVSSVQRLHTSGGLAPSGGCFAAEDGMRLRIGYSADYYFYTRKPAAAAARDFDFGTGY
jgi:hypothetical protein